MISCRRLTWPRTNIREYPFVSRALTNENRIALMVFLIAYALFEVPSNYFLKKLKPSVCPIHSYQHSLPQLTTAALDSLPDALLGRNHHRPRGREELRPSNRNSVPPRRHGSRPLSRFRLLPDFLVQNVWTIDPCGSDSGFCDTGRRFWRCDCVWGRIHEPSPRVIRLEVAVYYRRRAFLRISVLGLDYSARLSGVG